MSTFIIPAGTAVEVYDGQRWRQHTTQTELHFDQYVSMGIGKFTFWHRVWQIRVETEKVKGDWGRKK